MGRIKSNIEDLMAKSNLERLKHQTDNLLRLSDAPIKLNQAERLIARFGSTSILHARLNEVGLKINIQAIYKWYWPKSRQGTGGLIPTRAWPYIIKAAILEGIVLGPEDFDPRPRF